MTPSSKGLIFSAVEADAEQWAFESFAYLHPHEAHALDPEKFWKYFHVEQPTVSRAVMERALKETA